MYDRFAKSETVAQCLAVDLENEEKMHVKELQREMW